MGIFAKSAVGIEIDTMEIRAVHLEGTADRPRLCNFGRFPIRDGIVRDSKVLNPEELGQAISSLWEKESIKCRNVILGINNQDVIVRFAVFPKVAKDKLDNMIRFQSQDYIPIPLDEIELDYSIIGESVSADTAQYRVLLVAGRKRMLFDFIQALQAARLNVLDIGVSMLSIERIIPKELRNIPLGVINLSNDSGSILILNGYEPGMARSFSYNTGMVDSIRGFLNNISEPGYVMREEELESVCGFISGEIRSSVMYYQNQNPDVNIQNIAITGGIARTRGLVEKLKHLFEINVSLLGPFRDQTAINSGKPTYSFQASDYAVCASLATRGLED